MNTVLYLVLGGALVYAALLGWLYVSQRSMTYFPGPDMGRPADAGLGDMAPVTLTTEDGLALTAWYKAPVSDGRVLVLFHGNAGTIANREGKARPYLDAGLGVLLVEYRGYGGNRGTPSEQGLYADAAAALKFLEGEGIAPARWVLYGASIGAAVAVEAASVQARRTPVGALVLEAPFTSLVDVARFHYPYVPVTWLARERYMSIDKIAHVKAPVLVVHGGDDAIVPARFGHALFAAALPPKEAIWIAGAGHNDLYDFGAAARILSILKAWGG